MLAHRYHVTRMNHLVSDCADIRSLECYIDYIDAINFIARWQTKTFWDMSITVQTLFMFFISISLLIPSVYSFRFDKWKLYMICAGNWVIFSRAVKFLVDGAKISGSQDLVSYK